MNIKIVPKGMIRRHRRAALKMGLEPTREVTALPASDPTANIPVWDAKTSGREELAGILGRAARSGR